MVGTHIVATPNAARAAAAHRPSLNRIGVALFHQGTTALPGLGAGLRDQIIRRLPAPPSAMAWDFLTIALAAFAADRFILRSDAEDGWTRAIALDVAIADPAPWTGQIAR